MSYCLQGPRGSAPGPPASYPLLGPSSSLTLPRTMGDCHVGPWAGWVHSPLQHFAHAIPSTWDLLFQMLTGPISLSPSDLWSNVKCLRETYLMAQSQPLHSAATFPLTFPNWFFYWAFISIWYTTCFTHLLFSASLSSPTQMNAHCMKAGKFVYFARSWNLSTYNSAEQVLL